MCTSSVFTANQCPSVKLPVVSCADIGKVAYGCFKDPAKYKGKSVYAVGDSLTCTELMAAISEVTNKEYRFEHVTREEYSKLPYAGSAEVANMFEFKSKCPAFQAARDPVACRAEFPGVKGVKEWAALHLKELEKVGPACGVPGVGYGGGAHCGGAASRAPPCLGWGGGGGREGSGEPT